MFEGQTPEWQKKRDELAKGLTTLQRAFVAKVVAGMPQSKAYVAAGGTAKGSKSQEAVASRMLANVKVRAYYEHLIKGVEQGSIMTKEESLERLSAMARVSFDDFFSFKDITVTDDDGEKHQQTVFQMKKMEDIPTYAKASIKSITFTRAGPKIELHDAIAAQKQIAVMTGTNAPSKHEVAGVNGGAIGLASSVEQPEIAQALKDLLERL